MGEDRAARMSTALAGWGGPVGREEGLRGLLAAYLSIVAIFLFFF